MEEQRASKAIEENLFLKICITKSMAYYWIELDRKFASPNLLHIIG
jgi:hypothetical protein